MLQNILHLIKKYLTNESVVKIENLLQEFGDEPEVIKFILNELNLSGANFSEEDLSLIRLIALEYL